MTDATALLPPSAVAEPHRIGRRRDWFVILPMALAIHALMAWVLWHSLLTDAYGRPPLDRVIKDFYLGDQYAYLGIAANVEHGRSAYVEPYTATGSSIYPSAYFWFLGLVARAAGTNVIAAWNVVGMAVDLALCGVVGGFAWIMTRSRWAWVLGPVPLVIGTFQHWTIDSWRAIYGAHAVLWPATASLFSPGAEPAALLCCLVAVCLLALAPGRPRRQEIAVAATAGAVVGLSLSIHTYVAMFTATVAAGWFLVRAWQLSDGRGTRLLVVHVGGVALAVALVPASLPVLRLAVIVAGALVAPVLSREVRGAVGPSTAAFTVATGVVAAPMLLRAASQLDDRSSFLYQRQASGVATDLSLPLGPVLVHSLPALMLAAGCLVTLTVLRRGAPRQSGWSAAVVAILGASALLVFNESWGLQQEPYRFLPYAQFVLAAVALPFVVLPRQGGSWVPALALRSAAAALIVLSIPTTLQFARETPAVVQFPAAEQAAMRTAAEAMAGDGLGLLDSCLPKGVFKAVTGVPVVGLNAGLAYPGDRDAVQEVLAAQAAGMLADGATLDRAGVTSFVTMRECRSGSEAEVQERFGPPVRRIRFLPPSACGAAELELIVYRRPPDESGSAIRLEPPPEPATMPTHPFAPCVPSALRRDVA